MKIELDIINNTKSTLPSQKEIANAILEVLEEKNVDLNVEVDIKVVDKREIQRLNKKYRNLNKPTDVLSFPLLKKLPKKSDETILLGDIFISPEMAEDSILFLVKHATLHLLGYHHK